MSITKQRGVSRMLNKLFIRLLLDLLNTVMLYLLLKASFVPPSGKRRLVQARDHVCEGIYTKGNELYTIIIICNIYQYNHQKLTDSDSNILYPDAAVIFKTYNKCFLTLVNITFVNV